MLPVLRPRPLAAPWALCARRSSCGLPRASGPLSLEASYSPPLKMPPGSTTARARTSERALVMDTVLRTRSTRGGGVALVPDLGARKGVPPRARANCSDSTALKTVKLETKA